MKILLTGATGTIGRKLISALEQQHELRLLSRRKISDDPRWQQVDISDIDQVHRATEGMDAVIHLAIATGYEGDYEDDPFNRQRLDINVKGTYNLFEAARQASVKRVVHTSSLTVVWGYPAPQWVESNAPAKPVGTYALTKHLAEQIAEYYATQHNLSVICLRIPKPINIDDPQSRTEPILPQWIAFPDLIKAYKLALEIPDITHETVTLVGESSKRRWDLSLAEKVLGYRPQYRLEDLGYILREEPSSYDGPNVVYLSPDSKT